MKHAKLLGMAAVFAGSVALSSAAFATPIGFIPSAGLDRGVTIEKVMDGCGRGQSRDDYGRCYWRRSPQPYYRDGYDYGYRRPPPDRGYYGGYGGYGGPRPY